MDLFVKLFFDMNFRGWKAQLHFRPLAFVKFSFGMSAIACAFAFDGPVTLADTDSLLEMQNITSAQNLGESHEWQKILFYAPDFLGRQRSIVDDPAFFLAANGKTDSKAELDATLRSLFQPSGEATKQNLHSMCRFPRRVAFLIEKSGISRERLPQVVCKDYLDWLGSRTYEGVSLVFSSSYPNNPSSLFGHSFLRAHRSLKEQRNKLLDDAINFMAYPNTDNPLTYSFRGMAGGFPGFFSFTPYYLKVQEYSNADSRDLWEYRLDFSTDDIRNMIYVLWEMGPHKIDYYYFDENCSAVILKFLEAAKPSLSLTHLQFWVIPSDTVKTVANVPGLIVDVQYRPSALTRFLQKYRHLTLDQQTKLSAIVEANSPTLVLSEISRTSSGLASPVDQAFLVDAVLEFIDFYERLAGSNIAVTYGALRATLLKYRASLPISHLQATQVPQEERPDVGHDSSRLGIGAGVSGKNEAFSQYHWHTALHDKMSSDRGYSAGLGIDFFDLYLRYRHKDKSLQVHEFYPIRVTSLPNLEPIVKRPAWNLSFGTSLDDSCGYDGGVRRQNKRDSCRLYTVKGGVGLTLPLKTINLLAYSMVNLTLGHNNQLSGGIFAEPGLESGLLWAPIAQVKVNASLSNSAAFGRTGRFRIRHLAALAGMYEMKKNHELRGSAFVQNSGYREILAGYYFYF